MFVLFYVHNRSEIARGLTFPLDYNLDESYNNVLGFLLEQTNSSLSSASRIYTAKRVNTHQDFQEKIMSGFETDVKQIDLRDSDNAAAEVNQLVHFQLKTILFLRRGAMVQWLR